MPTPRADARATAPSPGRKPGPIAQEDRDNRGERDSQHARPHDAYESFDSQATADPPRSPHPSVDAPRPASAQNASPQSQDPETTNLYVGNLAASVTEEVLFREFQKFGPIQSVKVRQLRLSCAAG